MVKNRNSLSEKSNRIHGSHRFAFGIKKPKRLPVARRG